MKASSIQQLFPKDLLHPRQGAGNVVLSRNRPVPTAIVSTIWRVIINLASCPTTAGQLDRIFFTCCERFGPCFDQATRFLVSKCLLETRTSRQEAGGLQQRKGEIGNLNSAPQVSRTGEEPSWENWVGGL